MATCELRSSQSLEKWKEKASIVHNGKYTYAGVERATGKVSIWCPDHGVFVQDAASHCHSGCGCPKCGFASTGKLASISPSDFEEQAAKLHGGMYRYTGDYTRRKNKVTVVCGQHGDFQQNADVHLRGHGCPKCAQQQRGLEKKTKWTSKEFRSKMLESFARDFPNRSSRSKAMWANTDYKDSLISMSRALWGNLEFREKMSELRGEPGYKEKRDTAIRKCMADPDFMARLAVARSKSPKIISSLNQLVADELKQLGLDYVMEHPIGPWNFDIFVPSKNLLIECQGEYWHSLPRSVRNDKSKATYIERYHPELKLVAIWEVEFFKSGRVRHILERATGSMGKPKLPIKIESLKVQVIDRQQASGLYAIEHYLGSCRGATHYGLTTTNELGVETLIGACSFGSFQRHQQTLKYGKDATELVRFALSSQYHADNMGSWFLSRCVKAIAKTVVTYADTTQGHDGALYKACNFTLSHRVEPDYYYVDDSGWVIHKKSVWTHAVKMRKSESAYAAENNLSKKYGGEKLCFIKNK